MTSLRSSDEMTSVNPKALSEEEPSTGSAPVASRKRRWPLLLVLAAGLASVPLFDRVIPRDRAVSLRFAAPETVVGVELRWFDSAKDMLSSSRWSFESGAPRRLATHVQTRAGEVRAAVTVERRDGSAEHIELPVRFQGAEEAVLSVP